MDYAIADHVPAERAASDSRIAVWLLVCCAMVFAMVVLGGVTRLTHSGLSMVEWKPATGFLPPMSQSEWQDAFDKYKQYPEYQKINMGMTLDEFKGIFWFEFTHRLWGRLIGVVFFVPMVVFFLTGAVRRSTMPGLSGKLLIAFVLGGLQGVLGWLMVKSGMVDRPDVSQYRLTAHLLAAFVIYGYMFWLALGLLWPRQPIAAPRTAPLRRWVITLGGLIVFTVASGGFVAGLDAGFIYNTFPLMGGGLVPEEFMQLTPAWLSLFEDVATVQFSHRVLAVLTLVLVGATWGWSLRLPLRPRTLAAFHGLLLAVLAQVSLGITTLLLVVPVSLGAMHQAGALVVFTAVLWLVHELRHERA
jgi:cytochrome c oxidase assembly protein subunit 15